MNNLETLYHRVIANSDSEDIKIITSFLKNIEKKQHGEFGTYLSASLDMKRELREDTCLVSIPNTKAIHNNIAMPHGGILAVLVDTAMGVLANSKCPTGFGAVTTSLTIHYLAVATDDQLVANSRIVRQGRHTMVLEADIVEPDGKHIATATGAFFIVSKD
ncbi:MAG TPA: PaaI family thioesterase [Planococcus sp. (in: firmicutes)]|nr:PaaI family thioesterase [Planococcus sp. (in: firmicutes)]